MKFNILQYLPEKTKIKTTKEIRKVLFKKKFISDWSHQLKIPLKNMSRYKNGTRSIPLKLFNELILVQKLNPQQLQEKIEFKINNTGKYLRIGPIIKLNEEWIYISELIKGDGHITPNYWYITFVNKDEGLIKHVKDFFISLGIKKGQFHEIKREDANFLIIRSSLLAYIFNNILDVPTGRKDNINIKSFVMSLSFQI